MAKPYSTLANAVQLMDCFSKEEPYLGVREAARMTGLSSSTTGRVFASLRELGLLVQDMETRQYALAGKILAWAEVYTATLDIRRVALPYIYDLQRLTGETISLYVREGKQRVCVERVESEQNVRMVARVGRYIPLHAGSAGKLFLAYMTEDQQQAFLETEALQAFTPMTITDPEQLIAECQQIVKQGYSLSHGEWTADASGVAAPIFNQRGQMIAAMTISGPTQRFTPNKIEKFSQNCIHNVMQISRLLGYTPSQNKKGVQPGRPR